MKRALCFLFGHSVYPVTFFGIRCHRCGESLSSFAESDKLMPLSPETSFPLRCLVAYQLFQALIAILIFAISRVENCWIDLLLALGIIFLVTWVSSILTSIWAIISHIRAK